MAKELDASQKKAVNAELNSVVSAGAGSGKTSVLSARFAHLVLEKHYRVDQILTLTFTKKATVEMYSRIYSTLREKAPEATADFYKANIKTLDSYCAYVAKLGCRFYGVAPDFAEDNEAVYKKAEELSLPFILKHRDNFAIKSLVQTQNFADIARKLFVEPILSNSTIAEPIDFKKTIEKQRREIRSVWERSAKSLLKNALAAIYAAENYPGKITSSVQTVIDAAKSTEVPELPSISDEDFIEANSLPYINFISSFEVLSKVALPKGKSSPELEELKDSLRAVRQASCDLYPLVNYIAGGKIIRELIPLLEEFQSLVNGIKRSQGTLTFSDVASLATCILRDHPEIRLAEKKKYKAIMIDEFQDNNSMQKDLLFMLSEKEDRMEKGVPSVAELCKDKLFFVGDEKQSIYRFRGADVRVFRGLSKDFKDGNMELKTNYRSHPALIKAFNTIFGGEKYEEGYKEEATGKDASSSLPSVFYTQRNAEEEIPLYEAIYHKVDIPEGKKEDAKKIKPRIHIALYGKGQEEDEESLTGEEAEACWVAKKIKELTSPDANGNARYRYSDITVLFKTYSLQPLYERTFLKYGIPYNTEVVTGFFNDGPSNDIFSFMRICAYKKDSLAYAQVLRSPFVNLTNEEVNAILLESDIPFAADAKEILPPKSLERYERAAAFYSELSKASQTQGITKTLDKLWYEYGYRYETLWNRKVNMYASFYDRVFELARQADLDSQSLAAFTDGMRTFSDEKEKLEGMDIPIEKTAGVNIMTIHKSKGLEFPLVFICGAHKGKRNSENSSPVYANKEFGISINTKPLYSFSGREKSSDQNYFYNKMKKEEDAMEAAELRRVAYVAVTRAESEVYITAVANKNYPDTEEKALSYLAGNGANPSSIIQLLSPLIYFYKEKSSSPFTLENIPPLLPGEESDAEKKFRGNGRGEKNALVKKAIPLYDFAKEIKEEEVSPLYIFPSQMQKEDAALPSAIKSPSSLSAAEGIPYKEINDIVESTLTEDRYAFSYDSFGTLAHAFLQAAANGEEISYPQSAVQGLEGNKEKIRTLEKICTRMAEEFKSSPLGKAAFESEWKKTEYPFKSRIQDKIIKGTIDLIFREKDGSYTIVDYKTNQSIQEESYYAQLACYRRAIAQILGLAEEKVKCVLYYLRFAKAVDISLECAKVDLERFIE